MATVPPPVMESPWPPDVAAFAAAHGVAECLPRMLEATKTIFPAARRIEVVLEEDPEIADFHYLVFEVEVANLEVAQAVAAQQQWGRASLQLCPVLPTLAFCLGLELRE